MKLLPLAIILCIVAATANARSTFIINGENSPHVPFNVYLEIFRNADGTGSMYFGGGCLLSQSLVLTSAQNVAQFSRWRAGLGANRISDMQWFDAISAQVHPGYNASVLAHNIAIIQLVQLVPLGATIQPGNLLPETASFPTEGAVLEAIGFGFGATDEQPEFLQRMNVTVTSQANCEFNYPHLHHSHQTQNYFCARNDIQSANMCAGDQGGVAYETTTTLVVGIQSFYRVADCGLPAAQPSAYIRLARYASWINAVFQATYDLDSSESIFDRKIHVN